MKVEGGLPELLFKKQYCPYPQLIALVTGQQNSEQVLKDGRCSLLTLRGVQNGECAQQGVLKPGSFYTEMFYWS